MRKPGIYNYKLVIIASVRPDSSEYFDIEDNESQDRDDDGEDNSGVVDVEPDIQSYKYVPRSK